MSLTPAAPSRIAALRLASQHIGPPEATSPDVIVRAMLALQGQDLPGAWWSIGLRQTHGTLAEVVAAFDSGAIVRSWPLRGTLHVVAAEDLRWLLDLTTPRAIASAAGRRAVLGLTERDAEGAREAAIAALSGRRSLTRGALLAAFEAAGVSTIGQRGYHLLWYLAQTGTLVLGPAHEHGQAFALLDEWVPARARLDRDEALAQLALRFFSGHGPATDRDLARWAGLTLTDVRRGIAASGPGLAALELDGVRHHLPPEASEPAPRTRRAHLLPGFDEYLLGYADRSAVLAPEHGDAIVPGGNGMFKPTIVVDGVVAGTWSRTVRAGRVAVGILPFAGLPTEILPDLHAAAARYGAFLGRPVRLEGVGPGSAS